MFFWSLAIFIAVIVAIALVTVLEKGATAK
jgi:hypothetical protein